MDAASADLFWLCNMYFKKTGFHSVYYIGTMPRFVQAY